MSELPEAVAYQLRVAAEEIEVMQGEIALGNLPHIKAFLDRPVTRWILLRIQEMCWTIGHLLARRHTAPQPAQTVFGFEAGLEKRAPNLDARIWLDVTNSHRSGFSGGIARVAMKLAEAGIGTGDVLPVVIADGQVFPYPGIESGASSLAVRPDTVFVIVDTFWKPYDEYLAMLAAVRSAGGRCVLCIHDVIALDYPIFFDREFAEVFHRRLQAMLQRVDACVTVSDATLRQVRAHYDGAVERAIPMGSFRLGADFNAHKDVTARAMVRRQLECANVFVSVGTLEPRKGYAVTLDAFDRLWREGVDCRLVIFGQPGWICHALAQRILRHPEHRRRLHWFRDATDDEIRLAYRTAYCLIQASIVEGFGLPIVEACREGTPVIAANTEIFLEVGQHKLTYFKNCDAADLASKVRDALAHRPPSQSLEVSTWDRSLGDLVAQIDTLLPPAAARAHDTTAP